MAAGLPCIATRVGAVPDLIEHEVSGLLVPPGDSAALAGALATVLADRTLRDRLGAHARRRMADFGPDRERQAWESVLREVLDF
jgi:glycosyltransferase involved in cell wall biosynthesis